ncbi:hypothetical protein Tco_0899582 [Tanacetum coccineum]
MRIFFSSSSDRSAAIARDVLDSVDKRVITSASSCSFTVFLMFGKILETCALTCSLTCSLILFFICFDGIIHLVGQVVVNYAGNGRNCFSKLIHLLELREGGGGRVVVDTRGGSAIVVTETSTSEVSLVLRLNIESIPISGLGLSMLEMKPEDIEELYF